jgi:transcriptional regulator with XRE-family HTH domain
VTGATGTVAGLDEGRRHAVAFLRDLRELYGTTREEVGTRMGAESAVIVGVEESGGAVDLETLGRYAAALGARIEVTVTVIRDGRS